MSSGPQEVYLKPVLSDKLEKLLRHFFCRYDLDGSNTVNSFDELEQMCCNLSYRLDLGLCPDDLDRVVEMVKDKTEGEIIPSEIINKAPSAELSKDQTDEEGLGADYAFLNAVVRSFVEDHINDPVRFANSIDVESNPFSTDLEKAKLSQIVQEMHGRNEHWHETYRKLIRRIDYMEFKRRQAAPTVKVSSVAFGTGRRLPIVQRVD